VHYAVFESSYATYNQMAVGIKTGEQNGPAAGWRAGGGSSVYPRQVLV
jgi:hypothetical protein